MTHYKQGDVILIPFPFTDLSTFKQRPAVIISSDRFNKISNDVIIAAISSYISNKESHFEYLLNYEEQSKAGLPKQSVVKLGKVVTIDQRLIRKNLGHFSATVIKRILNGIIEIMKR